MSEDPSSTFLSSFPEYHTTIEGLRPLKRPMLLWSTVSLLYVFSGLRLKVDTASLWGFQILGMTDTKLTIFFFLTTFYYTVRWLWTRHLRLRTYKDEGFMLMLWEYGMPRSQVKKVLGKAYGFYEGFNETTQGGALEDKHFIAVQQVRSHRGAIIALFKLQFSARVLSFVEHFIVPYYAPLAIATTALIALFVRLCLSV